MHARYVCPSTVLPPSPFDGPSLSAPGPSSIPACPQIAAIHRHAPCLCACPTSPR
ncbi:hypothetical protein C8T65DRAFT_678908 [Cerioporus squamosus]|nr:hypothetical protein C8T65DRAFT_678908 [Cerioporus squamosus]